MGPNSRHLNDSEFSSLLARTAPVSGVAVSKARFLFLCVNAWHDGNAALEPYFLLYLNEMFTFLLTTIRTGPNNPEAGKGSKPTGPRKLAVYLDPA